MKRLPVYILAGGRSTRFGRDKARVLVDGEPLVRRVARLASPFAVSITIVADRPDKFLDLGLRTIGDAIAHQGPVGGLRAACVDAGPAWFALLSCDWLSFDETWLESLARARETGDRAVTYRGERFEPLLALYHGSILAEIVWLARMGTTSMQGVLESAGARALPLPLAWKERARHANTEAELRDWLASRGQRSGIASSI